MAALKIDYSLCVHCGACTGVCQSNALSLDNQTACLNYCNEHCSSCGICINACPLRAISK